MAGSGAYGFASQLEFTGHGRGSASHGRSRGHVEVNVGSCGRSALGRGSTSAGSVCAPGLSCAGPGGDAMGLNDNN